MTLDELMEEVELSEQVIEAEVIKSPKSKKGKKSKKEEFDDDEDIEEKLLQSLVLLEDCLCVLEEVIDPTQNSVTEGVLGRAENAALQTRAWLMLQMS